MPWTYDQRLERARTKMVDTSLLADDEVVVMSRPLFYGQYPFGLGVTPVREKWFMYDELKQRIIDGLDGLDYHMQSNSRTLQYNVFSGDVSVLRWFIQNHSPFMFNHLRIIDPDCWSWTMPDKEQRTSYYGEFNYRITFKDPAWGRQADNVQELDRLSGEHKLVVSTVPNKPGTFLYLKKLNDVLMFKLMHAEAINNIDER